MDELDRELASLALGQLPPWVGYQDKHDKVLQQYYNEVYVPECKAKGIPYERSYISWVDDAGWENKVRIITEKTGESYEDYVASLKQSFL